MGLDKTEKETFMKEIGLDKTGLNQLIREGYDLLKLERKVFLKLSKTTGTLARMEHMLNTGKPLRN